MFLRGRMLTTKPVPDWQVDKEEGGVVQGGRGKQERESSLKHQAIPVCGAVSIRGQG